MWDPHERSGTAVIACPECGAPAEVREKNVTPCRTWVAISAGGRVLVSEAEELLLVVLVLCAAGHRFAGPMEMLDRGGELSGWEERIA